MVRMIIYVAVDAQRSMSGLPAVWKRVKTPLEEGERLVSGRTDHSSGPFDEGARKQFCK